MSINVYNIEQAILDKMNSSSTELELLEYSKMLTQLKTGVVQVVDTYASLPSAASSVGHLYYVQDEKTVYWANAANGWITIQTQILNKLYGWGWGKCGVLGTNDTSRYSSPVQEISSSNWISVSLGCSTAGGIKTDGTLWNWACNSSNYELGVNCTLASYMVSSPIQEAYSSTNWCYIDKGANSTSAIKTDGTLWGWGRNSYGNLATNDTANKSGPTQEITSSTDWCCVFNATRLSYSALALKNNGTLWGFGQNAVGSLGVNSTIAHSSPVQEVSSSSNWCYASLNQDSSAGIKTDGTLWTWGSTAQWQNTPYIAHSSPVQEVSSSSNWCIVSVSTIGTFGIKTDGTLWSGGSAVYGHLITPTCVNHSSPVQELTSSTNWCHVCGNGYTGFGVKTDGTLWSWGFNSYGNLAIYSTINYSSPVQEVSSSTNWICADAGSCCNAIGIQRFSL